MIAWLSGIVQFKQAPLLLLNVGGVGYELETPLSTFAELPEIGQSTDLYVHMVVREDAQLLFAFISQPQRDLFRTLIKVNGVGPKVALAVLSTLTEGELIECMVNDDISQLTRVPGIGKKTAQRMVVELKDRLEKEFSGVAFEPGSAPRANDDRQDSIAALVSLGYKQAEASRVVSQLAADLSSEEIIRQALRSLSGKVL